MNEAPFKNKTLTIYIANDYQDSENNIVGENDHKGLIEKAYADLLEKKKDNSSIVLSIIGIENEN